eukprot:1584514-Pyramimonas_sp.AAC.1
MDRNREPSRLPARRTLSPQTPTAPPSTPSTNPEARRHLVVHAEQAPLWSDGCETVSMSLLCRHTPSRVGTEYILGNVESILGNVESILGNVESILGNVERTVTGSCRRDTTEEFCVCGRFSDIMISAHICVISVRKVGVKGPW